MDEQCIVISNTINVFKEIHVTSGIVQYQSRHVLGFLYLGYSKKQLQTVAKFILPCMFLIVYFLEWRLVVGFLIKPPLQKAISITPKKSPDSPAMDRIYRLPAFVGFNRCSLVGTTHWAFMMAICFCEATFSYKSYDLSDSYRLYISFKNNIGKALNCHTNLSDWYQLYISCKNNIETAITYPTDMKPWEAYFIRLLTDSCNHAEWVLELFCVPLIGKWNVDV